VRQQIEQNAAGGCGYLIIDDTPIAKSGHHIAGWEEIRILTDHGWLLVSSQLPKVELEHYLAETRWGCCAVIKDTSSVNVPMMSWYWDPKTTIAVPPGISCFFADKKYAHGGLSVQECVTPVLSVEAREAPSRDVRIEEIHWIGLRCRISFTNGEGCSVDLRESPSEPSSSVAYKQTPSQVGASQQASVAVDDDTLLGSEVSVVVVNADDSVVARARSLSEYRQNHRLHADIPIFLYKLSPENVDTTEAQIRSSDRLIGG